MRVHKNPSPTCTNHNRRTILSHGTFISELLQLLGTPLMMDEVYSLDPATLEQQPRTGANASFYLPLQVDHRP